MTRTSDRVDPLTAGAVMQLAAIAAPDSMTSIALAASGVGFWIALAADAYLEGDQ